VRALVLSAGTSLSATRMHEVTEALRAAAGGSLDIDLFTWRAPESRDGLRSATVLGPVTVYIPPPDHTPAPTQPAKPVKSAARSAVRRVDEPEEESDEESDDTPGAAADDDAGRTALSPSGQLTPRRVAGMLRWGTKRQIIRIRRSKQYQSVRRLIRGGIARQFSAKARRDPAVLACAQHGQVVLALDSGAIAAAWRVAKKVPGPPVVFGLPAAERELRMLAEPGLVGCRH